MKTTGNKRQNVSQNVSQNVRIFIQCSSKFCQNNIIKHKAVYDSNQRIKIHRHTLNKCAGVFLVMLRLYQSLIWLYLTTNDSI